MMKIKIFKSIICFFYYDYIPISETLWKHSGQSLFPGYQLVVAIKKGMES